MSRQIPADLPPTENLATQLGRFFDMTPAEVIRHIGPAAMKAGRTVDEQIYLWLRMKLKEREREVRRRAVRMTRRALAINSRSRLSKA